MIFLKRKRLIFWLLRAYVKRWGKLIVFILLTSVLAIALIYLSRNKLKTLAPVTNVQVIGIAGDYPQDEFPNNLPEEILSKTSRGLTRVLPDGRISPDVAKKWEIRDDGKTYIFYLDDNLYFTNGEKLESEDINYNFRDAKVERPAKSVIVFKLKDRYSPFLVTVANSKVFDKDRIGVSPYEIKEIKTKDGFVKSIELESKKDKKKLIYLFYPTQAALKDAYVLGDVDKIIDITNLSYKDDLGFEKFDNTKISKQINNNKITTVFLNNSDPLLSDKKIRKALAFSLPDEYAEGQRTGGPYGKDTWAYNPEYLHKKDLASAKTHLEESEASGSGKIKINLKSLRSYSSLAEKLSKGWKDVGIETEIELVDSVPSNYQAFLGELPVLEDPDQYTLWHTGQPSNITNYRNLRIDKLLEDGRRIENINERKKIYDDFQKYLQDDVPAIFLYFPYTYTLERK